MYVYLLEWLVVRNPPSSHRSRASISNANCEGVRWKIRWSAIERSPDNYAWQYLDDAVALADDFNATLHVALDLKMRAMEIYKVDFKNAALQTRQRIPTTVLHLGLISG